jgi:signal peptidase I
MVTKKISALYTLRKCKRVLRQIHGLYLRKAKTLEPASKERLQSYLSSLQTAILQKNPDLATRIALQLEETSRKLMPKTRWDQTRNFVGSILFALVVAIVIRQMWFEFYTIPTGSMRPTLKEQDYLVVSKSDYGINVPLRTSHFYFDPSLVKRGSIVVFTGENMDIADSDTTYFYLFPGKKQLVKRLIGKPGDILYFYGGQIYGISAQGKDLNMLRDPKWFKSLEYIPYIRFDGKTDIPSTPPANGIYSPVVFSQMNDPVAKLSINSIGQVTGEMIQQKGRPLLKNYSDLWGFKNYAMSRLLTKEQLELLHPNSFKELETGTLYLELSHHPSLQGAQIIRDEYHRLRPDLAISTSLIPLNQDHIDEIAAHMITCRFVVKDGVAHRLGWNPHDLAAYLPHLPDVPDGTYEIQDGTAYSISWGGVSKKLPRNHPLYRKDPERVQLLYNLGIEFLTQYNPSPRWPRLHPSRYAYFRNQELYLLGAPILKKEDSALILFQKREYQKQSMSTSVNPYSPFDDAGPPLTKEGKIDPDFIRKYGIAVPKDMYLVLGDNHAMSGDSRQFGFVPQNNLKGGVSFLFWPPGPRFGRLPQPHSQPLTLPNLVIWGSALLIFIGTSYYLKRKLQQPLKFE